MLPYSECVIPASTKANYSDTSGLIEPRSSLHTRYNLAGATTLVRVSASGLLPFRVINPTSEPIKIYRHTRLGTFLPECDHVADISVLSSDEKILQHSTSYQTNNDMPTITFHPTSHHHRLHNFAYFLIKIRIFLQKAILTWVGRRSLNMTFTLTAAHQLGHIELHQHSVTT